MKGGEMNKTLLAGFLGMAMLFLLPVAADCQEAEKPDERKLLDLYQNQQFNLAAEYLLDFYDESVEDKELITRLAYCYRMAGNDRLAEPFYLRLYQLDSVSMPAMLNLAVIYSKRLRYVEARDFFQRVVDIDSTHVGALVSLASLSASLGDADLHYEYLKKANGLQPVNGDIAHDFAHLCLQRNAYKEADEVLGIALGEDPDNGALLLMKARVSDQLKNHKETIRLCQQLISQQYETPELLLLLAKACFFDKRYQESIATYQSVMDNEGRMNELDLYYFAMAYKAVREYREAIGIMEKVLETAISPNTAFYYGSKASLHDLANQPSAAAKDYLKSFQFDVIPAHYYSLALVYDAKLTDTANALRYYRTYLRQELPPEEQFYVEHVQRRIGELQSNR